RIGPAGLAGQRPWEVAVLTRSTARVSRVGNLLPGREHGEGFAPQVHTDHRASHGRCQGGALHVDGERHEPLATLEPDRSRYHPRSPSVDLVDQPGGVLVELD